MFKLKLLRIMKPLSQWDLSRAARISQGRYSMIERGLIEPTEQERCRLAEVLGARPETLFTSVQMSDEPKYVMEYV